MMKPMGGMSYYPYASGMYGYPAGMTGAYGKVPYAKGGQKMALPQQMYKPSYGYGKVPQYASPWSMAGPRHIRPRRARPRRNPWDKDWDDSTGDWD